MYINRTNAFVCLLVFATGLMACTPDLNRKETASLVSITNTPVPTLTPIQDQTSSTSSTPEPTVSLLTPSPFASVTPLPPQNCSLGFGLRVGTVDVLLNYQDFPGIVITASSNMAEDYFRDLTGWIRVISAPSLDALQRKAERAEYNGVPYEALGYGLETSDSTPNEEWNDMVGSTQKAREIADRFGKLLIMGPGFRLMSLNDEEYAPMAALTDIWMIQTQRLQVHPPGARYREEVESIIDLIRANNPDIPVWAQITFPPRQDPDAEQWLAYHQSISDLVDATYIGVYNWDSVDMSKLIVTMKSIYSSICGEGK